jgi:hypothetical protein
MRRLAEMPLAFALKRLLGRPAPPPQPASAPATPPADPARTAAPRRRDPAAWVALAALVTGALLLVVFDLWFTRLLGVLALLAFIVSGVFAIANPDLLEDETEAGA